MALKRNNIAARVGNPSASSGKQQEWLWRCGISTHLLLALVLAPVLVYNTIQLDPTCRRPWPCQLPVL